MTEHREMYNDKLKGADIEVPVIYGRTGIPDAVIKAIHELLAHGYGSVELIIKGGEVDRIYKKETIPLN